MSGAINGFFSGHLDGETTVEGDNLAQLNYDLLILFTTEDRYDEDSVREIYGMYEMDPNPLGRMMPFVLLESYDPIVVDTSLTNPEPSYIDADILYVLALKSLGSGQSVDNVMRTLVSSAQTDPIRTILGYIVNGTEVNIEHDNIFSAFYIAFHTLVQASRVHGSWRDAMISVQHTKPLYRMVTGALLGAYYKLDSVILSGENGTEFHERFPNLSSIVGAALPFVKVYRRTMEKVEGWVENRNWGSIESTHDFIQILFPTTTPGVANRQYTLTPEQVERLRSNDFFMLMYTHAFMLMLDFYGLRVMDDHIGVIDRDRFNQYFLRGGGGGHNYLRITRILTSLDLFGKLRLHDMFQDFALSQPSIPDRTRQFWQSA